MRYVKRILIIFVIASIGYLVAREYAGLFDKHSVDPQQTQVSEYTDGIVVYYFHGSRRCPTCMAIEKYSHEAITPYINNNRLAWETVNIELPGNKHFIYDFNLASSGPVIVEYGGNKVRRRQALDKVWQLVRDKESFYKYVDAEVKGFLEKGN